MWPPTGIALAAVVILGPGVWPGIFLGAFLTNELTAGSSATSFLIASGNTLEALTAGYLVTRFAGGRRVFDHAHNIVRFVVAGFAGAVVSATIGVTAICFFGFAAWPEYGSIWMTWWLGDMAGAIVVAPVILLWTANPHYSWPPAQQIELALLTLVAAVIGWLVFVAVPYPLSFLTIPVCVWAGYRFGQREAATVTCALSFLAAWGSARGLGTFAQESPNDALVLVEAFMAVASIVGLTVGTAASERRRAEESLRQSHGELATQIDERTRELEVSERRLKTIIDTEPACVKLVSPEGALLDMNRAGLEMIGADDVSQVAGRRVIDLVHADDRDRFLEMHKRVCSGRSGRLEFRIVGFNGQERWVDSHSVPFDMPADNGEHHTVVLSVTTDITVRKRLEEELRQSQKMEAIGLLAGGIAHDFNNLLTAIAGNTDLVLMSLDKDDKRRNDLEEVAKAAQRAAALTRQLLAVSRRQMLQPAALDVNAHGRRRADSASPDDPGEHRPSARSEARRQRARRPRPARAGVAEPGDQRRRCHAEWRHAAADHRIGRSRRSRRAGTRADAGGPVRAAGRERHRGGHSARDAVAVSSNRSSRRKIATKEPASASPRCTASSSRPAGSSGSTARSAAGRRSRSTCRSSTNPSCLRFRSRRASRPARGSQTILLAEDDAAVRRFAVDVLRNHGYKVLDAGNGDEALQIAQQYPEPIHALVTDVVMPGMSGRDLAIKLTADRPDVRVIYTSGYTENVMLRAGFEHGLTLLAKPFLPGDLLRKVTETLRA